MKQRSAMTPAPPPEAGSQEGRSILTAPACSHCGDPCLHEHIQQEELHFCCTGCQTVYDILLTNGLDTYYRLEQRPGINQQGQLKGRYEFLEEAEIKQQILQFTDGKTARVELLLPQIHCASCVWLLEHLYKLHPGVLQSTANFLQKTCAITFDEQQITLAELAQLLHSIGYAPNFNLGNLQQEKPPAVPKSFYYRLGVAGFLFGNIMLLSLPEYLGLNPETEADLAKAFGYLNLALGIPLVAYAGWPYLQSAWLGLKQRQVSIDLPISLGILALFGRSAFEILTHSGAGFMDSLAGLIFFLLVGKWFQQQTYYHLSFERDYQSYFPVAAQLIESGKERSVSLDQLDPGDLVRIRHGEIIPADGILKRGQAYIDYSFVTGEAEPVHVKKGEAIFAGGRQNDHAIDVLLSKKVRQSYLIQLWNEQPFQQAHKTQVSKLAKRVATYFTLGILLIASLTLAYWLPRDLHTAIHAFTSVLIIACPCAVALSIPFTFGNALRLLARKQLYIKNTDMLEVFQQVTHIVLDKTGTLTHRNEALVFEGAISQDKKALITSLAQQSSHPRSRQIVQHWPSSTVHEVENYQEVPGKGISGTILGKEVVIEKATGQQAGTAVTIDGKLVGTFRHEAHLRNGLSQWLDQLKKRYRISLLSGDQDRHRSLFEPLFGQESSLLFNQSPKEKLNYIKSLQDEGATVLMIGDGLNDAGALQQADVGMVISEDQNNFNPACDAILSAESFGQFPAFLDYIRKSRYLVFASYGLALVYNVVGLTFAVQGLLSPVIAAILMPLSSITIVLFGMGSSYGVARQVLGASSTRSVKTENSVAMTTPKKQNAFQG